jgi:hypothetical protein
MSTNIATRTTSHQCPHIAAISSTIYLSIISTNFFSIRATFHSTNHYFFKSTKYTTNLISYLSASDESDVKAKLPTDYDTDSTTSRRSIESAKFTTFC